MAGANGWTMTPAGLRGVVNDAVAIYFLDATTVRRFRRALACHCQSGDCRCAFQMRHDEPGKRAPLKGHQTR